MSKRPTLTDLTSLTNSSIINAVNENWDAIQESFDNTLSRDGSTPNTMNADLDLNGNALLNVGTIDVTNLTLDGQTVTDLASVPEWRGAWVTATSYVKNDLVKTAGNVYICLVSHTSAAAFSTDLTAVRWELMVTKGDSGAGTGDLLSTNNLSDITNPATARSNLGLGTAATESTVPVAKGGTGATDATTARTNLSAQASDATLTSLSGLTLVAGDILYATGADTLTKLTKGTALQVLRQNAGLTAPEWGSLYGVSSVATTTSGTTHDLTGVPTTALFFTLHCYSVSLSGTNGLQMQLLDGSGNPITTGYNGTASTIDGSLPLTSTTPTSSFGVFQNGTAENFSGRMNFARVPGTTLWIQDHTGRRGSAISIFGGGRIDAGGDVTGVRLLASGANTFDDGRAYITWFA